MKKRIMIVEDEPITALAIKNNLESHDFEVIAIESSGRGAIDTAIRLKPDLIIMDITLSDDIDGIEAIKEITKHLNIPFLYLTAHHDEMTVSRAKETVPYGYLSKPIDMRILKNTIDFTLIRHEKILLEENLQRLSFVVENGPSMVVMTDTEGSIVYVNKSFTEITGYTPEEVIGKNPRILKSGLTPMATYQELWQTILGGDLWKGEFCNKRKSGDLYWESATISPLYDIQGKMTHFVAIKEDITDTKIKQLEIEKRSRILEFFYAISSAFIREESLEDSLKRCSDAMCDHLSGVISRIWLVDKSGEPILASQSCRGIQ
ncbi:MAG: PAS domain S-box protein [Thermodesulfovibrionales bacterium]